MSIFSWRKRATKHFGEVWFATADLHLLARDGKWVRVPCQIDSGAVVTLLPASILGVLGGNPSEGMPIEVTSVGGKSTPVTLYRLNARVGNHPLINLPVTFGCHDEVPSLLGWQGVFDVLSVSFDPVARQ